VEGVEMKGVGSGWSRQTSQLHTCYSNVLASQYRKVLQQSAMSESQCMCVCHVKYIEIIYLGLLTVLHYNVTQANGV